PFKNSVFTTLEIDFRDAPALATKTRDSAFGTFEAITSVGFYDHEGGGHIEFWDDQISVELAPGATIIFPAGSKRFSFLPVGRREKRYLVRQFCNAGVLRWLDKGGRNDGEFDRSASVQQKEAWEAKRAARGEKYAKLYSKLDEVFVV
ncbi:hypothetical protein C8R43DRAFT_886434, partial [Mycena crocata]